MHSTYPMAWTPENAGRPIQSTCTSPNPSRSIIKPFPTPIPSVRRHQAKALCFSPIQTKPPQLERTEEKLDATTCYDAVNREPGLHPLLRRSAQPRLHRDPRVG
ncbi:LOW QUALITY PROTEIN: hypothetical protein U9M48_031644 [Paspalum notatum var. saurae]|uniref:Uncharacterized protein n=1 Tax=Paspalum notatum var. saurae TaxID=547442 RepID=A0AAQ3X4K7_PASNO